ncbi:MAG TPA: DUF6600 domain-containing protein [Thermoanaerobaculia bacterium]
MRNALLLLAVTLTLAMPAMAEDRHQSHVSYDDGGTIVRTGDEGKEIEAHRNLPIYPGDEVITARRGRSEIRLSDGNIVGIDRATAIRFVSMLDSYEGDADQTVVELRYGKVAVHRTDVGRDRVRLDTENASYVAEHEAIYSVETDSRGRDRVVVFEGSVEVRTQRRASRLRGGESATIDATGVYEVISDQGSAADEFERWFLARSERFSERSTRYVDRRLSYWTDDLDDHGRWVFVTGIGWSWRPYVSVGWRPYNHGYWHHSRYGSLVWVSSDPWGWGPYHYGRWAHDALHGWIWVPGHGYSPAWVYWWYGPSYVGWAPAGWWDCYRPYYNWAYQPYRNRTIGFGFYGQVRVSEMDLHPWTFMDSGRLVSTRVDRAALTTDAVKHRLGRGTGAVATISGSPARFTREEFRDPAAAVRQRGIPGAMTGGETGAPPTDMTPFFRRDDQVTGQVRDRIASARGSASGGASGGRTVPSAGGSVAPIGSGSVAPIGRGSVAPIGRSTSPEPAVVPSTGATAPRGGGQIDRGTGRTGTQQPVQTPRSGERVDTPRERTGQPAIERPATGGTAAGRSRSVDRGSGAAVTPAAPATREPVETPRSESWRNRTRSDDPSAGTTPSGRTGASSTGSRDVPRRVIDQIGGARVVPRDSSGSGGSAARESSRSGDSGRAVRPSPPASSSGSSAPSTRSRDSGSSTRSRDSGSSSGASTRSRDSGSGSSTRSSGSSGSSSSSSSSGSRGETVKRDN